MRIVGIILMVVSILHIGGKSSDDPSALIIQKQASTSDKRIRPETYDRVLDILFPRDEPAGNYYLVLRFRPSSHPETQVVIKRGVDKAEVIEYSTHGHIYSKLNELISRGAKEDPAALAKLIKVQKRSVQAPHAQIKEWHATFLENFGESLISFKKSTEEFDQEGTLTVVLHGTFYDLWYSQGLNELSFSFYDEDASDQIPNGQLKVVQWMNRVRRDVKKLR